MNGNFQKPDEKDFEHYQKPHLVENNNKKNIKINKKYILLFIILIIIILVISICIPLVIKNKQKEYNTDTNPNTSVSSRSYQSSPTRTTSVTPTQSIENENCIYDNYFMSGIPKCPSDITNIRNFDQCYTNNQNNYLTFSINCLNKPLILTIFNDMNCSTNSYNYTINSVCQKIDIEIPQLLGGNFSYIINN